ncbi:pseudaminic acid synthase [Corallincola platygyrae]|uniref:Pseudaminic acid synthase n=1 Tax=Corallincola platygyrae TaxID=1193278 RepID=A0ABW4XJK9_9GAMM
MSKEIVIAGRKIGPDHPPYIIAELSANHNGDLNRALQHIEAAKAAGADAIKIQTYTADTMTIECDKPEFKIEGGLWDGYSLYQLYEEAHTPYEWHQAIFEKARELGITCFSSPFDETAVDLLESLDAPAYKIASFEAVDLPLIRRVASTGKPMIISTGMANLAEIEEAVQAAKSGGCDQIVLLHCISGYPVPADQSNLHTVPDLGNRFDVISGLSDHTLGTTVSVASVALGASVIEKHFTLSREDVGPDSSFSLEPAELAQLCNDTKTAWQALGKAGYERKPVEEANLTFRRSVYAIKDIVAGEALTSENIKRIRPGFGLAPKHYPELLGRCAKTDIERGTPLSWDLID